jgi:hypothetical protein
MEQLKTVANGPTVYVRGRETADVEADHPQS